MGLWQWLGFGRPDKAAVDATEQVSAKQEASVETTGGEPWTMPIQVPIEDFIDLHTFRPKETRDVVTSYIEAAREKGFQKVRVIHGKGKGVQRRSIQSLLKKHPDVIRFEDAPAHRGGWGATMVWLKTDS